MKVRFQADNDLNKAIVRAVIRQEPAVDFRSAQAARFHHVSDPEVLKESAQAGRILVSHDFQTMPEHFREYVRHRECPGVFLIPQHLPVGVAAETLLLVWAVTEPREWENRLRLVPSLVSIAVGGNVASWSVMEPQATTTANAR
jgi:hypothetical protein